MMVETHSQTYKIWHDFIETPNAEKLAAILHDDVKFHSPFVWKPKTGRAMTTAILLTVTEIFEDFRYVREITNDQHWALEFEATVGGFSLRGVDLIELDADGKIFDFEVMIRPANALQKVGEAVGCKLSEKGFLPPQNI